MRLNWRFRVEFLSQIYVVYQRLHFLRDTTDGCLGTVRAQSLNLSCMIYAHVFGDPVVIWSACDVKVGVTKVNLYTC